MRDVSNCDVHAILDDLVSRECGVAIFLGNFEESFIGPSDRVEVFISFLCPEQVEADEATDEPIGQAIGGVLIDVMRAAYQQAMSNMPVCEGEE